MKRYYAGVVVLVAMFSFANIGCGSCPQGSGENESNDTLELADEVTGVDVGNLCGEQGDEDWWFATLNPFSVVVWDVVYDMAFGDVDIEAVAFDGSLIDSSAGTSGVEDVAATVGALESVYLHVIPFSTFDAGGSEYTITTTICEATGPNEVESNNTIALADVGDTGASGVICAADEDFFSIAVGAGQTVTVDLTYNMVDGDLDLDLLDSAGGLLDDSAGTMGTEQVVYTSTNGETVYVRVFEFFGDTVATGAAYSFTVTLQ